MLDLRLRFTKEHLLAPVAERCPSFLSAAAVSSVSLACCVGAGVAAWSGAVILSIILWLVGRVLDGLDGAIARANGSASDFGGYVDLLFDTIGYTAVPLGIAFGVGQLGTWQIIAVLLGSFYVNSVSWLMLSALLEKRGERARGEQTGSADRTSRSTRSAVEHHKFVQAQLDDVVGPGTRDLHASFDEVMLCSTILPSTATVTSSKLRRAIR